MTRKQRLVFLGIALAALLIIARTTLGSFDFVFRDFWFSAGLLLLVLLSVVDQPHFSAASNVFLNGIAGLIVLLTVLPASRTHLWSIFFAWSWYLVISSYVLMLWRSAPLRQEPKLIQLVTRLNRRIGRPEALFSAFFLWGIYTQFTDRSGAFAALMWYWAIFMILDLPGVSELIGKWLTQLGTTSIESVGTLTGFISPRIAEAEVTSEAPSHVIGKEVKILGSGSEPYAFATVIDDRVLSGKRRIRMGITKTTERWRQLSSTPGASAAIVFQDGDKGKVDTVVSVVDKGSDLGTLRIRVNPATELQDGDILWTILSDGTHAFYQIVGASITEDSLGGDDALHEITVTAGQLGRWIEESCTFEPVTWVAPAGGLVHKGSGGLGGGKLPDENLRLGVVPNSNFPVHVSLQDVVTHNAAILGVTGSGKSYLTLHIVAGLVNANVRVLVLDISRQYWPVLAALEPSAIKRSQDLQRWLDGDGKLGIYQFADSDNFTRTTAEFVERCFDHLRSKIELRAGVNEPAHLCVIFEEAHSLIPEWNQVAFRDDTANVNHTARTILQGRKYGMGCIVVSQRTANVTKTVLNQCNTIVAFQCFDQTGLDFLKNYMGHEYADAISNLATRRAILVGKAASSKRPVQLAIDELSGDWSAVVGGESDDAQQDE